MQPTTTFQRASSAATTLVGDLFEAVPVASPAVAVGSAADGGVVVPARLRLEDSELRHDIGTYTGRVRSPRFTAAVCAVAAAAAAPSPVDLSAESAAEHIAIAEHLRTLHLSLEIRHAGIEEAGSLAAVGDVLWQPDRTSGATTAALAVWELLPRIDAGVVPRSVASDLGELFTDQVSYAHLAAFQKLWRAALSGHPAGSVEPTVLDWLALAREWADLHSAAFPNVAFPDVGADPTGVLRWPDNPTADPLGRHLAATLQTASLDYVQRLQGLADELAAPAATAGIGHSRGSGADGAGGAMASGRRTVDWREPTERDLKNRRIFSRGLVIAGHRAPSIARTPVAYPSGRLNTRQLVAQAAQRASGLPVTAKPWTARRAVPRTSTRLRLAVIVDASATMQRWAQTTAPLGWAAAHATAELGGQHSLWGFGGVAFPIVTAGIAPAKVPVVLDPGSGSAGAGTAIRSAIADVDGDGVGLVVVVTDGLLPDPVDVQEAVDDAVRTGFTVLWVMPDRTTGQVRPRQAHVIDDQTPSTVAEAISDTAFALLTGTTVG